MSYQNIYMLSILLFLFLFINNLVSEENNTFLLKPTGKYNTGTTEKMVEKFTKANLKKRERFNKVVNLWVIDNKFVIDYLNIANEYIFPHIKSDYYSLLLLNTTHLITSDTPLIPLHSMEQQESFYGNVDGKNIVKLTNRYILYFYNLYLKNIPSDLILKEIQYLRNKNIKYILKLRFSYQV